MVGLYARRYMEWTWSALWIPRHDILYNASNLHKSHSSSNFDVAFMPTWRGTHATVYSSSNDYVRTLAKLLEKLDSVLDARIVIWIKLHPMVSQGVDLDSYRRIKAFPADVEPYCHLAQCELLVTDYSSVMFDYMCSERPVVLYLNDLERYKYERDFCLNIEDLPFY